MIPKLAESSLDKNIRNIAAHLTSCRELFVEGTTANLANNLALAERMLEKVYLRDFSDEPFIGPYTSDNERRVAP